ncbi:uncharacterized protein LOC118182702 [Stegodyphus dumicola]|uniref:uncharacterized protein LOC118182702 n=1 Tax=Stegodyphus dumicola TaxID=202533 RepID=UPI0015AE0B87|nr:uncharacterized protein LOC118182702 [Stegodyphus dumicola]
MRNEIDPNENEIYQSLETFEKKLFVLKNNRHEVQLPWKRDWGELNNNFIVTKKRLNLLMRRLQKDTNLHLQYIETLTDYENKNNIEKVRCPKEPVDKPVFYLPHQLVFIEKSATTKIRIVFDASPVITLSI